MQYASIIARILPLIEGFRIWNRVFADDHLGNSVCKIYVYLRCVRIFIKIS